MSTDTRPAGWGTRESDPEIVALYESGQSLAQIARAVGRSHEGVRQILKRSYTRTRSHEEAVQLHWKHKEKRDGA